MKKEKILIFILVIFVLLSVVTGCNNGDIKNDLEEETTQQAQHDLPVLKHLAYYASHDINNDPTAKYLEAATGYKVEYYSLPRENGTEKLMLDLASGVQYDSIQMEGVRYFTLAGNGALVELDELLNKYGNNIKEVVKKEVWDLTKVNDKTYGLPQWKEGGMVSNLAIRQDVLDKLGLEIPTTPDELYSVLKVIKEKTDMIPFVGYEVEIDTIQSAFSNPIWSNVNGELLPDIKLPGTKDYLYFMQKLYKDGLMDKDWPILKHADKLAKITNGKAFMWYHSWYDAPSIVPNLTKNVPEAKITAISPLKDSEGKQALPYIIGTPRCAAIPKNSKNAEHVVKWWNKKLDAKVFKEMAIGVEGVHYIFENGVYKPILPKLFDDRTNASWYFTGIRPEYNDYELARVYKDIHQGKAFEQINAFSKLRIADPINYIPPLNAIIANKQTLYTFKTNSYMKFICNGISIIEYDRFIEEYDKSGGSDIQKEVNEWYIRNKK